LLKIYGNKEDLDKIEAHAKTVHLSTSAFIFKTVMSEISRHPSKESLEEQVARIVEKLISENGINKTGEHE